MALFKPLKGTRASLDSQPLHEGYAYFCTDDGSFHIDFLDADGNLQRKQLNAKDAETIMGTSLTELQSNWTVNDETDPAYVKNRTHWVDSPQQATLFESQDVDFKHDPDYNLTSAFITLTQNVKDGDAITFVFDEVQYDITLQSALRFGNMSILNMGENTGEPFLCVVHENECDIYTSDTDDATHTIKIYWITQEYHKLDRNYLPDDAVLPIIGEYEDGHTLVARNGEWITEQPAGIHFGYGGEIFNSYNGVYANEAGVDAHAEGYQTKALGQASHTSGQGTIASGVGQYVFGTYNVEDTSASTVELNPTRGKRKYVHIVGNGINEDSRSNAHTLDWSGNAWFAGDVKVGGTGQDDEVAKTLATTAELTAKAAELTAEIESKVEKVDGMGLSSNDYTDAEQAKLATVDEGATATSIVIKTWTAADMV